MKALTLWQPWASLVSIGAKQVETRVWKTDYRGELAIHAARSRPKFLGRSAETESFRDEFADAVNCRRDRDDRCGVNVDCALNSLPLGAVLCIVNLVAIEETSAVRETLSDQELCFGNYDNGRYAWFFKMVALFDEPIPAKGNRLLWNWPIVAASRKEKASDSHNATRHS